MDSDGLKKSLSQLGGCGLISLAWFIVSVGYMIYWFASGGDPEVKKFYEDCYRRETRGYPPGNVPDDVIENAALTCMKERQRARARN